MVREAFLEAALADRLDFARTGKTRMLAITGPEDTESILGAAEDTTTPSDVARAVFYRAGEPKQLLEFAGGHYDVYEDNTVQQHCIAVMTDFLLTQLHERRTSP